MVTSVWIACPLTQTRWHKVTKTWRSQSNKIWLVCIMCILCEKEGTNKALKTVHFHSRLSVEHSGETESYNRRTTFSRWALTRRNCFLENSINNMRQWGRKSGQSSGRRVSVGAVSWRSLVASCRGFQCLNGTMFSSDGWGCDCNWLWFDCKNVCEETNLEMNKIWWRNETHKVN